MKKALIAINAIGIVSLTGTAVEAAGTEATETENNRPNIILCMADDMGWGDTGYNGNTVIKTPNLDQMSKEGVTFTRFYSGAPVCSPTRGSCYTGRHPFRYGITYAMSGKLEKKEIPITTLLKKEGYVTGHFGKWHMGALTPNKGDQSRWGGFAKDPAKYYCPPWERDVDTCFVTESKVPTWNPMITPSGWKKGKPGTPFGNDYFIGKDKIAKENLEGDDSRVMMDRAIPFIENAVKEHKPFFAVIWFHAPHKPVVAGPEYLEMYKDAPKNLQHYYGCITALDEQVGRLRKELKNLKIENNTMLWFCSDNGPVSKKQTGGLAGCKRSLREGGVRVPGLLVWPDKVKSPHVIDVPASTSDYFPTILAALNIPLPDDREYDGINLLPVIAETQTKRNKAIGFMSQNQIAWTDDQYKIYSSNKGKSFKMYDLLNDKEEKKDVSASFPEIFETMKKEMEAWKKSVLSDKEKCEVPTSASTDK